MWFHIGANMDQRERAYIGTMTAQGLGVQSTNGLTSTRDLHLDLDARQGEHGHRRRRQAP